jgi:hypothetical protein
MPSLPFTTFGAGLEIGGALGGKHDRHWPPIPIKDLHVDRTHWQTDLGPAAKALVEKIASATGTLYGPLGTILQAAADVSADKIRAEGETDIELARRRGLLRLAAEETKKQANLDAVYGKTFQICLESGVGSATIEQMIDDWIVFHSEKARLVSDPEMQTLWARVMAVEAKVPGSFSKRTLETLSVLEKTEAHLFTSVCRFIVRHGSEAFPVILYAKHLSGLPDVYTDLGIDHDTLLHLATIGLVHYNSLIYKGEWRYFEPALEVEYFNDRRTFLLSEVDGSYSIEYGVVHLTHVGHQLAKIAGAEPVEGFFDFLEAEWAKAGISRQLKPKR